MHHKTFFYALLITVLSAHGMEQDPAVINNAELVFYNPDIMPYITEQICIEHKWKMEDIESTISNLLDTNKRLHSYYCNEQTGKKLVRNVALHNYTNDLYITEQILPYKIIKTKICNLFEIAYNKDKIFTEQDLHDQWYHESTQYPHGDFLSTESYQKETNENLLLAAIGQLTIEKVTFLIAAKINCNSTQCKNPISFMASMKYHSLCRSKRKSFYAIVRLLLDHYNMHPDSREIVSDRTLLHQAVRFGNKHFARSLLKRGANPYRLLVDATPLNLDKLSNRKILRHAMKQYCPDHTISCEKNKNRPWLKNAFDLEDKAEPWLQALIDAIELERIAQNNSSTN